MEGESIYTRMEKLFPICRNITGEGFRKSLNMLQDDCNVKINVQFIPSGTKVFDWTVPKEWNIKEGYIEDSSGKRIVDFSNNNLHIVGYSLPVDRYVTLKELKSILHTQPAMPDAIPYVTSYYQEQVGFCISQNQYDNLKDDIYHIYINSTLSDGFLTYGEIYIPGESNEEIFFSTYLCHPSMANNELSGPCLAIELANRLSKSSHRYSYRIVIVPETIGSIAYLSKNLSVLKSNVIAGFNLSCLGDDAAYTYVESRYGNTLADKVVKSCLSEIDGEVRHYRYLKRGSDERQYNMPGIDLPVVGLYRSKSNEYKEYHTSADNMDFVKPKALQESYDFICKCIEVLEANKKYVNVVKCEPQLGKYGLYPKTSERGGAKSTGAWKYLDVLAYADGTNDIMDISAITGIKVSEVINLIDDLSRNHLIKSN